MERVLNAIEQYRVVTICRGVYGDDLRSLVKALHAGGIRLIEITFDQADPNAVATTSEAIKMVVDEFPDMFVGCGTATSVEHVHATKEAGGVFVLSPNVDEAVIKETKDLGLISIPGAMTPSEIITAVKAGADVVKVFPAGYLGTGYIKDVKGPINNAKFLAAAGINEENMQDFYDAGYSAFGISGRLVDKKLIAEGNFNEIENRARKFMEIVNSNK